MKNAKKAAAVFVAAAMMFAGCGKTDSQDAEKPNSSVADETQDTEVQESADDTETTSRRTSSGEGDYVSPDPRVTPVKFEDYWISEDKFDYINYCLDQGATVKYLILEADGSYTYCLPEELESTGKTPIAIGSFFDFGGEQEYVSVYCPLDESISDQFWVSGNNATLEQCLGRPYPDEQDARITIDDHGNTFSLSTVHHLPIIFEHMMFLSVDSTVTEIRDAFYTYYID